MNRKHIRKSTGCANKELTLPYSDETNKSSDVSNIPTKTSEANVTDSAGSETYYRSKRSGRIIKPVVKLNI